MPCVSFPSTWLGKPHSNPDPDQPSRLHMTLGMSKGGSLPLFAPLQSGAGANASAGLGLRSFRGLFRLGRVFWPATPQFKLPQTQP